jgi:hypothetical protein
MAEKRTDLIAHVEWMRSPPPNNPEWNLADRISHNTSQRERLAPDGIIAEHDWGDLLDEAEAVRVASLARMEDAHSKLLRVAPRPRPFSATVTLTFYTPTGQLESRGLSIFATDGQNLVDFVEWFEDVVGCFVNDVYDRQRRCLYQSAAMASDFATG